MVREVVIIGSGPAGYTAAVYSGRAQLAPLVFAGSLSGGQLMLTTDVENYPGFPEGIMGPELMENFRNQAERFGAEVVYEDVVEVDFSSHPYRVKSASQEVEAKTVIISTGASAKLLGLEAESRLMGHGVSTCATCDGFFFRGQEIAIVGGGDSAMEEATFLTRFADKVTVIHRRDSLRASKIMQQKAIDHPKIEFMLDSAVTEIFEEDAKVCGIEVENLKSGEKCRVDLTGLFVAIGHTPNTQLFDGKVELHDNGYIRCIEGSRTSVDGVFACGDVQDFTYRQAITAAGSGCMAAIDAERWIEHQGN
ncbi:MAG: thioredoxin-disulfide reductase [Planctomycetes bacterium]|jgi:thioredoxin reductase (NADPH)|nr:thioredoxin-disulfide reductase [Planctomycetota bacterium]MBT6452245.1 thioredoxin-disulfide reductase [Planctomycetota bacterium]MBT6542197.1 thioredoxin-disulfide reductase [Planctomycetota bacterium]MBT6785536.1 thioredoxin-disulfide reductase [Planctomycetota bacterium]MBT6969497.1 thioredoxin-disulfide reductase [Planctomycetota bacterium]